MARLENKKGGKELKRLECRPWAGERDPLEGQAAAAMAATARGLHSPAVPPKGAPKGLNV